MRKLFSVCGKSEGGGNIFLNFSRVVDFRLVFKCVFENIPNRIRIQYLKFFTNLGIPSLAGHHNDTNGLLLTFR